MPNLTLEALLSRGYFPKELPPPFSTAKYGQVLARAESSLPAVFLQEKPSRLATHNLARRGMLRRKLGIPNPINFFNLSRFVVKEWTELRKVGFASPWSLSRPVEVDSERCLGDLRTLKERAICRVRLRGTSRYILKADVSRFYDSIYVHSIPWAMHGKSVAKANRNSPVLKGNVLDRLMRICQDDQTSGIPVGPDTSLLAAEIILGAVDAELKARSVLKGFRYIDDYEFGFRTIAEAEQALVSLQEVLAKYELALNDRKTRIINLPWPTDPLAISELRVFQFRPLSGDQRNDLLRYFDRAFVLSNETLDESVLKYAVARIRGEAVSRQNWELFEDLLLQCAVTEPEAISVVLNLLLAYRKRSYSLNGLRIGEVFNEVIRKNAPLGHGNEVAWAIWGLIVLKIPLEQDCVAAAVAMDDPFVALVLLDAKQKGFVPKEADMSNYSSYMTAFDLWGSQWLIAYEAGVKKWLPSSGVADHIGVDPYFSYLRSQGVSFYDEHLSEHPPILVTAWTEEYAEGEGETVVFDASV